MSIFLRAGQALRELGVGEIVLPAVELAETVVHGAEKVLKSPVTRRTATGTIITVGAVSCSPNKIVNLTKQQAKEVSEDPLIVEYKKHIPLSDTELLAQMKTKFKDDQLIQQAIDPKQHIVEQVKQGSKVVVSGETHYQLDNYNFWNDSNLLTQLVDNELKSVFVEKDPEDKLPNGLTLQAAFDQWYQSKVIPKDLDEYIDDSHEKALYQSMIDVGMQIHCMDASTKVYEDSNVVEKDGKKTFIKTRDEYMHEIVTKELAKQGKNAKALVFAGSAHVFEIARDYTMPQSMLELHGASVSDKVVESKVLGVRLAEEFGRDKVLSMVFSKDLSDENPYNKLWIDQEEHFFGREIKSEDRIANIGLKLTDKATLDYTQNNLSDYASKEHLYNDGKPNYDLAVIAANTDKYVFNKLKGYKRLAYEIIQNGVPAVHFKKLKYRDKEYKYEIKNGKEIIIDINGKSIKLGSEILGPGDLVKDLKLRRAWTEGANMDRMFSDYEITAMSYRGNNYFAIGFRRDNDTTKYTVVLEFPNTDRSISISEDRGFYRSIQSYELPKIMPGKLEKFLEKVFIEIKKRFETREKE